LIYVDGSGRLVEDGIGFFDDCGDGFSDRRVLGLRVFVDLMPSTAAQMNMGGLTMAIPLPGKTSWN